MHGCGELPMIIKPFKLLLQVLLTACIATGDSYFSLCHHKTNTARFQGCDSRRYVPHILNLTSFVALIKAPFCEQFYAIVGNCSAIIATPQQVR